MYCLIDIDKPEMCSLALTLTLQGEEVVGLSNQNKGYTNRLLDDISILSYDSKLNVDVLIGQMRDDLKVEYDKYYTYKEYLESLNLTYVINVVNEPIIAKLACLLYQDVFGLINDGSGDYYLPSQKSVINIDAIPCEYRIANASCNACDDVKEKWIVNGDIRELRRLRVNKFTYGMDQRNDARAVNVLISDTISFDVYIYGELFGHFQFKNRCVDLMEYLAIISLGYQEGYEADVIQQRLDTFDFVYNHLEMHEKESTVWIYEGRDLIQAIKKARELYPYYSVHLVSKEMVRSVMNLVDYYEQYDESMMYKRNSVYILWNETGGD